MSTTTILSGSVACAPIGALGCDTVAKLSSSNVQTLAENGFKFCVRYVNYYDSGNLTATEAQAILDGGLALMVVQAARTGIVSAGLGTDRGNQAVTSCTDLGLPAGVNVWLDLESVSGDVFGYANNWYDVVLGAEYVPGVYVGGNIVNEGVAVTSQQLYQNLKFQHYWRSQSQVPNVDTRGYQMIQLYPETKALLGFDIDIDITQSDYLNGAVQWLAPEVAERKIRIAQR